MKLIDNLLDYVLKDMNLKQIETFSAFWAIVITLIGTAVFTYGIIKIVLYILQFIV